MSRRPVSEEIKKERRDAVKKELKALIFPLILTLIIGAFVYVILNFQNVTPESELVVVESYSGDEAVRVLENDKLKFTLDPVTTHFEVLVKDTGKVWKSNPDGISEDALALPEEKGKLNSTLILVYSNETGMQATLGNYTYSIENGIYDIDSSDDEIRVSYSIGKVEKEYIIPPVTTEENFEKWTSLMDNTGKNFVQQYYKKYDIKKLGKKDDKEALLESYPILETEVIYVLRDSANENVKKTCQKHFEAAGYTYEDLVADKELDSSTKTSDVPIFTVDMVYKLDGDDLLVEVPMSSLGFKDEYPIYTLSVLPYFGAGGKNDEGYMMVPEGGGGLINFNNGKVAQASYFANLYGWDMCISRDAVVHNTRAYYNAFGISDYKNSVVCTIDEGATYAAIQANTAGKVNEFNYVNPVYSICSREQYDVGEIANSDIFTYYKDLPEDEALVQRYSFVSSGDYVDMAKDYSKYLQNRFGDGLTMNSDSSTPVTIEIVGAVDKVKQILGIPVSRPLQLTTYKEATDMITTFKNTDGIDNLTVKLTGWCNGGVEQKMLNSVRPIASLGSTKDLKNLVSTADSLGVDLYLNGVTQYAKDSNIFNGFFSYTDAAKFISKERAKLSAYSSVTYAVRENTDVYFLLHTDKAIEMADNLVGFANKVGANVAFEDIGMDLSSDFYKKDTRSRESVKNLEVEKLAEYAAAGNKMMINMGNDYAIGYVDSISDMDLRGSEYTILDESIPFYQLAIHGFVDYTGKPINISGNEETEILYCAEYGAGLAFSMMDESSFALQKTLYTEYYGSEYDAWHNRMVSIYERYNKELGHVFNQEMTGHDNLTNTVSVTEYADGTKVYVNYGYSAYEVGEVVVPARDYLVVR